MTIDEDDEDFEGEPSDPELVLILTDKEAGRLRDEMRTNQDPGAVVRLVLGEEVWLLTEKYHNVSFVEVTLPDAIGKKGEWLCRVP